MTQTPETPPGQEPTPPSGAVEPPGGCGAIGCFNLSIVLGAVLLVIAVLMALFRPGLIPPPGQ